MPSTGAAEGGEGATPPMVGLTALIIAQARAIESRRPDRLFDDPLASGFVTAAGPSFDAGSPEIAHLLRLRGDYVAVRTRLFDYYLLDACRAGCRQVVLLAAGLDARAFRLAWPEEVPAARRGSEIATGDPGGTGAVARQQGVTHRRDLPDRPRRTQQAAASSALSCTS